MPQCHVYRCIEPYSGGLRFFPFYIEERKHHDGYRWEYLGQFFFSKGFLSKLRWDDFYECWDEAVLGYDSLHSSYQNDEKGEKIEKWVK